MYRKGLNDTDKISRNHFNIPEENFELFKNNLTEKKIKQLNQKLKQFENKGYITYKNYFISMKSIFDSDLLPKENLNKKNNNNNSLNSEKSSSSNESDDNSNKNNCFDEIYDLIFERFREVTCIIKNNKNIFYLTDYKRENFISSYNLICALSIFIKTNFENKIKLLFYLSDNDEDGFLNKNEIEYMITTINLLFGEEINDINMNSSILSQSLINIKVNNILNELLYSPGDLNDKLIKEQNYINFDMLYESIKKMKNYKYRIIPCFINFKDCLFCFKKEKMINIKNKHKKDFINITSSLILEQNKIITKDNFKKFSLSNLSQIIKPIKINTNKNSFNNEERKYTKLKTNSCGNYRPLTKKRKNLLKNDKSLKELIKNSTIFNENEQRVRLKSAKIKNHNYKKKLLQYAFQANYSDIRNIEVEPGIIKFIPDEIQKKEDSNTNNYKMIKKLQLRKKKTFIDTENKNLKIDEPLTKKIEKNKEGFKRGLYKHRTIIKDIKENYIKGFKSKLCDSFSTKSVININKNTTNNKRRNSIHITKNDNNFIKINNNNNNKERYKTLDEILQEISKQEKKLNFKSNNNINNDIIKEYKELQLEINTYRKNTKFYNKAIKIGNVFPKFKTNRNKNNSNKKIEYYY